MKSSRLDLQHSPVSLPLSSADGIGGDKQKEKGNTKSRIPRITSPAVTRYRTPPKRAADSRIYEATRPKSATTRLPPTHPAQLLHDVRQPRPSKERPALKRPPNLVKTSPPFRPSTPVIKVPLSSEPAILPPRDDGDSDGSVCSYSNRCREMKRRGSKMSSDDKKRIHLKIRWQENMTKFESLKRQLHDKQRNLLELYATLRTSHKTLSDLGHTICLPPSEDLNIMNVAKLTPEQLLQLCAGTEASEIAKTNPPFDLVLLREIPNKIVATCEQTLNSRQEIIDWFDDVMAKKMITKNVLAKKIKDFKAENEEFKRSLDKNKEDYLRLFNETDGCLKMCGNNNLSYHEHLQRFSLKLAEMNAINDNLKKKLLEMEKQVIAAENKSGELELQLMDEKHRKRDPSSKAGTQSKHKDEKLAQITEALEKAQTECLSLERVVCVLREEKQQMQSSYEKKLNALNESIDINTKLFDEITADRTRILEEKRELENQLIDLSKKFEETLCNTKRESNETVADLIETQKKYKEALDEKSKLADKIESMCAQLLESELRFKDASNKLTEMELASRNIAECRKEIEMLSRQLENAKEEILEYKKIVTKQQETIQEIRQNWNIALTSGEQLRSDLYGKELSILELEKQRSELEKQRSELEKQRSALEKRMHDSELKTDSYAEELSNLKNQIAPLQKVFGGFKTIEELHETIKQQTLHLIEAKGQNESLTDALRRKDTELQQRVEKLRELGELLEDREAELKMLADKNEEQSNIIKLLRNNLDDRTQADIEINRQIDEKNTEIESLIKNVEKRKQQISQLEKIIITLENQIARLSDQKRTAREAILSLEKKLCEYESYYMNNAKKTESTDNLDDLINILEYELTEPSDNKFKGLQEVLGIQNIAGRRNKRGTHYFNSHPENNADVYQTRKNETIRSDMGNCFKNNKVLNNNNHKGDGVSGNKMLTRMSSSKFIKAAVNVPKDTKNTILPTANQTTNVNYCLTPNYINDGKRLKMLKLAGHKLQ